MVSPLRAGDKGSTQAGTGRCLIVIGDRDLKVRVAVKGARIEVRFTPQRDREKEGGGERDRQTNRYLNRPTTNSIKISNPMQIITISVKRESYLT